MPSHSIIELLSLKKPVSGPGIWDALSAKIAQRAGFEMAFLSGYGLSASLLGEPDFGLITQTLTRLLTRLKQDGTTAAELGNMMSFHELNRLLGLDEKYAREKQWKSPASST